MPFRPMRVRIRRSWGVRVGVVGLAALAASSWGISATAAASAVTVPLDPDHVEVALYPVENIGPLSAHLTQPPTMTPVPSEWGGSVVVQFPTPIDAGAMSVSLDLVPTPDGDPTRTYSTTAAPPDQLTVSDLGSGSYRVDLPADDAVNGPYGVLTFEGLGTSDSRFDAGAPVQYFLQFTGTGTSVQNLAPQILAVAMLGCSGNFGGCTPIAVDAGAQLLLTVPPGSLLRALGLGTLDDMALALEPLDANGGATGDPIVLSDNPALVSVTDSYHATVTVPGSTKGGTYGLIIVQSTGSAGAVSITLGELQVKGRPVQARPVQARPAAPRIVNAGLFSDTGWVDAAPTGREAAPSTPLVAAGAGMMALAGVGVAASVRGHRRQDPCRD